MVLTPAQIKEQAEKEQQKKKEDQEQQAARLKLALMYRNNSGLKETYIAEQFIQIDKKPDPPEPGMALKTIPQKLVETGTYQKKGEENRYSIHVNKEEGRVSVMIPPGGDARAAIKSGLLLATAGIGLGPVVLNEPFQHTKDDPFSYLKLLCEVAKEEGIAIEFPKKVIEHYEHTLTPAQLREFYSYKNIFDQNKDNLETIMGIIESSFAERKQEIDKLFTEDPPNDSELQTVEDIKKELEKINEMSQALDSSSRPLSSHVNAIKNLQNKQVDVEDVKIFKPKWFFGRSKVQFDDVKKEKLGVFDELKKSRENNKDAREGLINSIEANCQKLDERRKTCEEALKKLENKLTTVVDDPKITSDIKEKPRADLKAINNLKDQYLNHDNNLEKNLGTLKANIKNINEIDKTYTSDKIMEEKNIMETKLVTAAGLGKR